MAKPAKPVKPTLVASEGTPIPKGNNKKLFLFIAIGALLLIVIVGASWYVGTLSSSPHEEAKAAAPQPQPKFVALDPFTVNLQDEGSGDQFLQVGITLKLLKPELEEKVKQYLPEIRSRLLLLLSSKRASELTPAEGKTKLAREIVAATEAILDPRTTASGAIKSGDGETAPVAGQESEKKGDIDILFTSFIIQ
jgi:flagellar FliL protein